jgi:tetratricopeptide (TPR) repeat protein
MEIPPGLTPAQIEEYNSCYKRATALLNGTIQIHGEKFVPDPTRLSQAVALFTRCLEIVPAAFGCHWFIGKSYQAMGDHDRAMEAFEKATALNKDNPDIPREACVEAMRLGDAAKAERYAQDACKRNREDAGLVANLAVALLMGNKPKEALAQAEKALRMAPKDPVNERVLGLVNDVLAGRKPAPKRLG